MLQDRGSRIEDRGRRRALAVLVALTLAGCGFHLRGPQPLPFDNLHVAIPDTSELGAALKRRIRTSGATRLVDDPKDASAILQVVAETREKSILSINAAGRVREFQLRLRFSFRVADPKGAELLAPTEIVLTRDYSFNDSQVLAKEQEEALLYRDMQADLVQQILRRLAAAKPGAAKPAAG